MQGCGANEVCYSLPQDDCSTPGVATDTDTTNEVVVDEPSTTTIATEGSTTASDSTKNEATPPPRMSVCGSDYNDAVNHQCTNDPCPNGDVSSRTLMHCHVFSTVSCFLLDVHA